MTEGRIKLEAQWTLAEPEEAAVEFLAGQTPLSRNRIKDAMNKGAVWLLREGKERRLRRARTRLFVGDRLSLFYDSQILATTVPSPRLLMDQRDFSLWDKPPGMLSQGTRFGDHLSLMRWLEASGMPERRHWLIHRLDREASGVILVAHSRAMAGQLSALFQNGQVEKRYRIAVRLDEARRAQLADGSEWRLDAPLDGKKAVTRVRWLCCSADGVDQLEAVIETGRKHQIRRHLAQAGYPVLGDPSYGNAASRAPGLHLRAVYLAFPSPRNGQRVAVEVDEGLLSGPGEATAVIDPTRAHQGGP